jgi:hypothetical protein
VLDLFPHIALGSCSRAAAVTLGVRFNIVRLPSLEVKEAARRLMIAA